MGVRFELLGTRLACLPADGSVAGTFKPAVSLGRIFFDGDMVTYRSRRGILTLPPVEFLAKLTIYIPDRYQNIRRYAGFNSSEIQRRVRVARGKGVSATAIDESRPVRST
ncbi:MAG: hypothetical protein V2A66_08240 [Pseudomonadota bacterium]